MSDDKEKPIEIEYIEAIDLDEDEIEGIISSARPVSEADAEELAKLADVKKVVIPQDVKKQMEEAGIDINDVIGTIMRGGRKPN